MRRPHHVVGRFTVVLLVLGIVLVTSCGKDGDDNGDFQPDPDAAALKVEEANEELEWILYDDLNDDDIDEPDDVDVTVPQQLYHEALELDPDNLDAHFGVAVTDLIALTTDPEVNGAFDEWKAYLEDHTPFEVPTGPNKILGVSLTPARGRDALLLPWNAVPICGLTPLTLVRHGAVPHLSRVQAILEQRVLPRLVSAANHLDVVGGSSSYHFIVSGRMQGDDEADPVEIDRTDILALRTGCLLLSALTRVAVAYELNFADYDAATLRAAIQPGSSWLGLRGGGVAHMQRARTDLLSAIDQLEDAITSLLNERDNQDDDVIKIGPDDLSRADVDSVRNRLPDVRASLENGYTLVEDWDDDSDTPDRPLKICLGALFANPIADWKAMLPAYEGDLETRATEWDWTGEDFGISVEATVPTANYYYFWSSLHWEVGGDPDFYCDSYAPWFCEPVQSALEAHLDTLRVENPGLTYAYFYTYYHGYLDAGVSHLNLWCGGELGLAAESVYVPVLVWRAADYEHWTWPDPTFHGFLPDINSTRELLDIFGMDENEWEPRWVIDWSELD